MKDDKSIKLLYVFSVIGFVLTIVVFGLISLVGDLSQPYKLTIYDSSIYEETNIDSINKEKLRIITFSGEFDKEYKEHGKKYVLTRDRKKLNRYDQNEQDYIVVFKTDSIEELKQFLNK
jgi:hypothetical protein